MNRKYGVAVVGAALAATACVALVAPQASATHAGSAVSARQAASSVSASAGISASAATRTTRPLPTIVRQVSGARGKVAYLTFDDGPNRTYTPQVLGLLRKHHAKATFFMIGSSAKANPALVRQVRAEGHAIGNHTFSHPWLHRLSRAGVAGQLRSTDAVLGHTTCMRPPGGFVNSGVTSVSRGLGKSVVLWSVDTSDWSRPGAARINASLVRGARPGAILLMHDGGGPRAQTVAALGRALTSLSARGYRFETLPMCR